MVRKSNTYMLQCSGRRQDSLLPYLYVDVSSTRNDKETYIQV